MLCADWGHVPVYIQSGFSYMTDLSNLGEWKMKINRFEKPAWFLFPNLLFTD